MPLDIVLFDRMEGSEVLNMNRSGDFFDDFEVSNIDARILPAYNWPQDTGAPQILRPVLLAESTLDCTGLVTTYETAPKAGEVVDGTEIIIEEIILNTDGTWSEGDLGLSGNVVVQSGTAAVSPQPYISPSWRADGYQLELNDVVLQELTGARVLVKASGKLLGMLVIESNGLKGFVYPAHLCP